MWQTGYVDLNEMGKITKKDGIDCMSSDERRKSPWAGESKDVLPQEKFETWADFLGGAGGCAPPRNFPPPRRNFSLPVETFASPYKNAPPPKKVNGQK